MNNQSISTTLTRLCVSTTLAVIVAFLCFSLTQADSPQLPDGSPTQISVPAIGLSQEIRPVGIIPVVVNGTTYFTWNVLDSYVGWHNLSARPGQVGNTVLSGHSDAKARVFQKLHQINISDEIAIVSGGQIRHYMVTNKLLLQEKGTSIETRIENARWIAPTNDERLTLVTCARPGATHRLIVVAYPVE